MKHKRQFMVGILAIYVLSFLTAIPVHGYISKIVPDEGLTTSSSLSSSPLRSMEYTEDGICVSYSFPSYNVTQDAQQNPYGYWSIPGFSNFRGNGLPAIPMRADMFSLPLEGIPQLEITKAEYTDYHGVLASSMPIVLESDSVLAHPVSMSQYVGFYPESPLSALSERVQNDSKILTIQVAPIQYDCANEIIRVYESLEYQITWSYSNEASRRLISPQSGTHTAGISSESNFLSNAGVVPLNHDVNRSGDINALSVQSLSGSSDGFVRSVPYYFIITPESLKSEAQRLASWKNSIGFKAEVVTRVAWNTPFLTMRLKSLYSTYHGNMYCLLLGDFNLIPTFSKTSEQAGEFTTDTPYFYLAGDDYLPDMKYGRLPASSLAEAKIMIDKIIEYEKNPPRNSNFYNNVAGVAVFEDDHIYGTTIFDEIMNRDGDGYEDRRYCKTSQEIYEYLSEKRNLNVERIYYYTGNEEHGPTNWSKLFDYGDPIPTELRQENFNWHKEDVLAECLKNGCLMVYYNGHGLPQGWTNTTVSSTVFKEAKNGRLLPFVFSVTCLTGVDGSIKFLKEGLINPNGGSIGYIAAGGNTYTGFNDVFSQGMINAFWPSPGLVTDIHYEGDGVNIEHDPLVEENKGAEVEIWEAMQAGFLRMEQRFPVTVPNIHCQDTRELYYLYADPSLRLYTQDPYGSGRGEIYAEVSRKNDTVSINCPGNTGYTTFYDTESGEIVSYIGAYEASITTGDPDAVVVSVRMPNRPIFLSVGKNAIIDY